MGSIGGESREGLAILVQKVVALKFKQKVLIFRKKIHT
jgi:hypothetical protein